MNKSPKKKTENVRFDPIIIEFNSPDVKPPQGVRVIVHVPRLDKRDQTGINFGRFLHSLAEWRIEGSNSSWEIDWWCDIPVPNC